MKTGTETINPKTRKLLEELHLLLCGEHPDARIPRKGFNMANWRAEEECGTTACALGWATMLLPSFRKIYKFNELTGLGPRDRGTIGHGRAMGLSSDAFDYLFISGEYPGIPTTKQVARRIEKFLEDGKWKITSY